MATLIYLAIAVVVFFISADFFYWLADALDCHCMAADAAIIAAPSNGRCARFSIGCAVITLFTTINYTVTAVLTISIS